MSWLASLAIAVLTGAAGGWTGGFVMTLWARWHRHSSMEGGTAFAVLAMTALGAGIGFAVGLVLSRFVPQGAAHAFWKGLGLSLGAVVLVAVVIAIIGRATADVPPEIDGRRLVLELELRLPSTCVGDSEDERDTRLALGADARRTYAIGKRGTVTLEPADDGVLVSGTVPLDSRRTPRLVALQLRGGERMQFELPIRARPGRDALEWSAWEPLEGTPTATRRFRVQLAD